MSLPSVTPVAVDGGAAGALALTLLGLGATRTRGAGEDGGDESGMITDPSDAVRTVVVAAAFGISGFLAIVLWTVILGSVARGILGPLEAVERTVVLQSSVGLGTVSGAGLYLAFADRDRSFLDVYRPTARDGGYVVGGLVVIFGTFIAFSVLMSVLGVDGASHGTRETIANAADPTAVVAVFVVTSVLVIGPGEELLYRNVVQKSLYDAFSRPVAIVIASVIFAAVHFSAYSTASLPAVLLSLLVVFVLSLTLGAVYERTDNVVVPAAVHGLFNAAQFALIAADQSGAAAVVTWVVTASPV